MASPIRATPTLNAEQTERFLKMVEEDMDKPLSPRPDQKKILARVSAKMKALRDDPR